MAFDQKKFPNRFRMLRYLTEFSRYLILAFFTFIYLFPFILILFWAFKTETEISLSPFTPPSQFHIETIIKVWNQGRFSIYLPNSVIYSIVITIGACSISALAGYAFAQLKFPGRQLLFTLFLAGLMVPFFAMMIPMYYLNLDLGLFGTRWALIVPRIALGLSFGIFFMRAFFQSLPRELAEAAKIDGCNEWSVFIRIMLPLAGPGFSTLAVFEFLSSWNMFIEPLIFVQSDSLRPVGLAILFFTGRYFLERNMVAMGILLTIGPVILAYLFLQRQFIEGITSGAVKS